MKLKIQFSKVNGDEVLDKYQDVVPRTRAQCSAIRHIQWDIYKSRSGLV